MIQIKTLVSAFVLLFCTTTLYTQKKTMPSKAEAKDKLNTELLSDLRFRTLGPALASGSSADFAVTPQNTSEYYVASAAGGVWKTDNAGTSYMPVFHTSGSVSI